MKLYGSRESVVMKQLDNVWISNCIFRFIGKDGVDVTTCYVLTFAINISSMRNSNEILYDSL